MQRGPHEGAPILKPTGFLSNSAKTLQALDRRCTGRGGECSRPLGGRHVALEGRIASDAAIYPRGLCRAVLRGVAAQLREDRRLQPGCFGIQAVDDTDPVEENVYGPAQGYSGKYRDDLTGQVLKDQWVMEARMKELAYFRDRGVWSKRPRSEARAKTGKGPVSCPLGGCEQGGRYRA